MGLNLESKQLKQRLQLLSKKTGRQTLDKALEAGGNVLVSAMEETVPVDTGELKSCLGKIRIEGSHLERKILTGISTEDRAVIERGYYQEYGHSTMVGKKWMKRASQKSKKEAVQTMVETLKEELKE